VEIHRDLGSALSGRRTTRILPCLNIACLCFERRPLQRGRVDVCMSNCLKARTSSVMQEERFRQHTCEESYDTWEVGARREGTKGAKSFNYLNELFSWPPSSSRYPTVLLWRLELLFVFGPWSTAGLFANQLQADPRKTVRYWLVQKLLQSCHFLD
jgi:hypothetical protein